MAEDRYKILKQIDDVWANSVPIIVPQITILEDLYTGKKIVRVTIRNIGPKIIQFVKLSLAFLDNQENIKSEIECEYNNLDLKINQESTSEINLDFASFDLKNQIQITLHQMNFEKEEKLNSTTILKKMIKNPLSNLDELDEQYKREIHKITSPKTTVNNKYEKSNGFWQCSCGNYYFDTIDICPNCKIEKLDFEKIGTKEYLENELNLYRKKQQEIKEETIKKAKTVGNHTLKIAIITGVAIILGIILVLVGKNAITKKLIKENKIDIALKLDSNLFSHYKDYMNDLANQYHTQNNYEQEAKLLKNVCEYALEEEYFSKLLEAQYQYILQQYDKQDYEKAYLYLEEVLTNAQYQTNEDLRNKATIIKYHVGLKEFEKGQYENAKNLLENLNYEDSEQKLDIAKYHLAKLKCENKEYKQAKELIESMKNPYEDSQNILQEANYGYAIWLIDQEKYEDAYRLLVAMKEYKESQQHIYTIATTQYNEFKNTNNDSLFYLNKIKDKFTMIAGYADASNFIAEIEEALKWHGTWHNAAFSSNVYYKYDIKCNYFKNTITVPGLTKKVDIKLQKVGDKFVSTTGDTQFFRQGEYLIYQSDVTTSGLKYIR